MSRPGVVWILSSAVGLALLPGCLGKMAGTRVEPQQPGGLAEARQSSGTTVIVQDDNQRLLPVNADGPPVAPPPSNPFPKPDTIRQTALEKSPKIEVVVQPSSPAPPPPLESVKTAKLAPASSEPPLVEALRSVLNNEPEKALEHLKGFGPTTQDFLIRLLPAISRLGQRPLEQLNPEEVAVLQNQFEDLLETLRPFSDLAISRMCCCKWIKGYGNYEPMPDEHLFYAASKKDFHDGEQVKVYVELRNFRCEHRDRYHEIRLSSRVEIRDPREPANAEPIWFYHFEDQKEPVRSRAQLHDFFNYYTFSVPHIPPGTYTLTIQVADETVPERRRLASKSQEFRVTGGAVRSE